ncbi:MAG: outer membrane beta-barrel domain-containing protein [Proteobacteria bacterium]|nr:outer membrane beta-barrel domain-containing protein [Pseudomonadota bacterium]
MAVFILRRIFFATILSLVSTHLIAAAGGYKKATEGEDVVKNKLYPKKGKLELNGPNLGMILNQSYLNTYIVNGGVNYFWNEVWGVGLDFSYALNADRNERNCIENFYNDPDYNVGDECGPEDNLTGRANYGPAYVNIGEYNYIFSGSAIWNPIYGKEIFFLSAVGYFDVYTTLGGGLAMTTFYPESKTLRNGKSSREGAFAPGNTKDPKNPGADPGTTDDEGKLVYGKEGRPNPVQESKILLQAGVGQKFHFAKSFSFKMELRDHIVIGTPGGFDMFFTLWGGLGYRF